MDRFKLNDEGDLLAVIDNPRGYEGSVLITRGDGTGGLRFSKDELNRLVTIWEMIEGINDSAETYRI